VLKVRQQLEGAPSNGNTLLGDGNATGTANRIIFGPNGATGWPGVAGASAVTPAAGDSENQFFLCDKRGNAQARVVAIHPLGRARVAQTRGKDMENANIAACP
jgi:hypothetical protein